MKTRDQRAMTEMMIPSPVNTSRCTHHETSSTYPRYMNVVPAMNPLSTSPVDNRPASRARSTTSLFVSVTSSFASTCSGLHPRSARRASRRSGTVRAPRSVQQHHPTRSTKDRRCTPRRPSSSAESPHHPPCPLDDTVENARQRVRLRTTCKYTLLGLPACNQRLPVRGRLLPDERCPDRTVIRCGDLAQTRCSPSSAPPGALYRSRNSSTSSGKAMLSRARF